MSIVHTKIPEVIQLEPQVFADDRGFFFEAYNDRKFAQETGIVTNFVQDNHSGSKENVLRGLHYQIQWLKRKCPAGIALPNPTTSR